MKTPNNLTRVIASLALPALSLLAVSTPAQAQEAAPAVPAQDLRQIEVAARAEIRRQAPEATVEITPMDPRLRLPNCDRPLQASLPPNINLGARATVRVSCGGGTVSWMATVPVSLFTEVPVVVLRRALPMGSIVGAEDVTVAARRFPGTVKCCATAPEQVVGRLVRRSLSADQVLPLDAVEEAPAVRRGETVTVLASLPGLQIRASGVALADARAGETVRVRHATTLKVFQARADTQGVVRVDW
jgi:flagella basal body P-ring formation protein FlgA